MCLHGMLRIKPITVHTWNIHVARHCKGRALHHNQFSSTFFDYLKTENTCCIKNPVTWYKNL